MAVWDTISRLWLGLPRSDRVATVECVGEAGGTPDRRPDLQASARQAGLILDTRIEAASAGKIELGSDFHFSDLPTVTAGFIGFSFDIRK